MTTRSPPTAILSLTTSLLLISAYATAADAPLTPKLCRLNQDCLSLAKEPPRMCLAADGIGSTHSSDAITACPRFGAPMKANATQPASTALSATTK